MKNKVNKFLRHNIKHITIAAVVCFALFFYAFWSVQRYRMAHAYNELVRLGQLKDTANGRYFTISNAPQSASYKIVMMPGLSGLAMDWRPLLNALDNRCPALVVDRAGYGLTTVPGGDGTPHSIAKEMALWPQIFALEKPFILVAHSFAGLPAMLFAARFPEQIKSVVLLDPSTPGNFTAYPESVNLAEKANQRRFRMAALLAFSGIPQYLKFVGNPGRTMHPEIQDPYNTLVYSFPTISQAAKEYQNMEANDSEIESLQLPKNLSAHLLLAGQTLAPHHQWAWRLQRKLTQSLTYSNVREEFEAKHEDFIVNPRFNVITKKILEKECLN